MLLRFPKTWLWATLAISISSCLESGVEWCVLKYRAKPNDAAFTTPGAGSGAVGVVDADDVGPGVDDVGPGVDDNGPDDVLDELPGGAPSWSSSSSAAASSSSPASLVDNRPLPFS